MPSDKRIEAACRAHYGYDPTFYDPAMLWRQYQDGWSVLCETHPSLAQKQRERMKAAIQAYEYERTTPIRESGR